MSILNSNGESIFIPDLRWILNTSYVVSQKDLKFHFKNFLEFPPRSIHEKIPATIASFDIASAIRICYGDKLNSYVPYTANLINNDP